MPLYWHVIFSVILLVVFSRILIKHNEKYLLLLLTVNVFGNMPQILGYFFYDEFFTLILSVLYIWIYVRKKGYKELKNILCKTHTVLLIFFSLYMLFQTIIGIVENEDFRIIRWSVFYIGLIPLYVSVLLSLNDSKISGSYVLLVIILYFFIYLLIGIYFYFNTGNQFYSQINLIAGTSYAFFPILLLYISMTACILRRENFAYSINNYIYIILAFLVFLGMYFDSKLIQVSLILWIFTLIPMRKYFLWIKMVLIYVLVVVTYVTYQYTWVGVKIEQIEQIEQIEKEIKVQPSLSLILDGLKTYLKHNILGSILMFTDDGFDFTRSLQTDAVMLIFNDSNVARKMFGYGAYSHRTLMADKMRVLFLFNNTLILSEL